MSDVRPTWALAWFLSWPRELGNMVIRSDPGTSWYLVLCGSKKGGSGSDWINHPLRNSDFWYLVGFSLSCRYMQAGRFAIGHRQHFLRVIWLYKPKLKFKVVGSALVPRGYLVGTAGSRAGYSPWVGALVCMRGGVELRGSKEINEDFLKLP